MAFDYKKEYKEFYMPKNRPEIVTVPSMNYLAVRGKGDPNTPDGVVGIDYGNKSTFQWIFVIRLPDFITEADFAWAVQTADEKKKLDCSAAEFLTVEEGLCVQMLHVGSFDSEPASVALMDAYIQEQGYENDFGKGRLHHEIYLSDARKTALEKLKTVIRHPIRKAAADVGNKR